MRLFLVSVGHKQPTWIEDGCQTYLKRLPKELAIQACNIKPEYREGKTREQILQCEATRIRQSLKQAPDGRLVVLDEKGSDLTTRQFASRLDAWLGAGQTVTLLLGSADGLAAEIKATAAEQIRLSSLTLPHGLAKLLLCEQLYRAISLLRQHPYHREG
jgi:23S rRNA (pseudouridine1915-N3)-methyltransferase